MVAWREGEGRGTGGQEARVRARGKRGSKSLFLFFEIKSNVAQVSFKLPRKQRLALKS